MKIPNFAAVVIVVVLVFYLLNAGEALLLPLVIAIVLWYLINTLSAAFNRISIGGLRAPTPVCLVASLLSFLLVVWALISFLGSRMDEVMEVIPTYQANLTVRLESIPLLDIASFQEEGGLMQLIDGINLPALATSVAASFAGVLASGGLILIYILFLFLEQGNFNQKITALFASSGQEEDVRKIIDRVRNDIQKYISIKMFTSSLTGILSYSFLLIMGVDFAGVWGLLIFLLNFIPTVGSIIATIFPAMIALAQFNGYSQFIFVLVGIGVVQVCIGNILEPRLMGNSFNLSPIVILLNLGLWGYIWGITGMFLCVPFLIIITIVLSHFPQTRPIAIILSSDGRMRAPLDATAESFSFAASASSLVETDEGPGDK